MVWRILSGGAIAAIAGAAMLAASSDPSPAFTLELPSLERRSRPPGSSRCIGATGAGMAAGIVDGAASRGIVGAGVRAGVGGRTIIAPGAGAATMATGTASAAAGSAAGATVTAPGGEARLQACIFATSASEISTLAVTF